MTMTLLQPQPPPQPLTTTANSTNNELFINEEIDRMYRKSFLEYAKNPTGHCTMKDKVWIKLLIDTAVNDSFIRSSN